MKKERLLVFCLAVCGGLAVCCGLRAQEVLRVTDGAILSVSNGATLSLKGGITLDNGSTLVNQGRIILARNSAGLGSDWFDKGTIPYGYGAGAVVFNSDDGQIIQSVDSFQRIEVNSAGLQLAGDVLTKQWYLINGVVSTGGYNAVVVSAADTAVEADRANPGFVRSWIAGNLRRYLDLASADQYSFPVGAGANANRVVLDNLKAAPLTGVKYIDVHFGAKPGNDAGLILTEGGTPYTMVNTGGVWYLTPDAEPVSGAYDLLLYFDGFSGLKDDAFAILRRPDGSSDAKDWVLPAGGELPVAGSPGRTVEPGYARRNGVTAFSQFGIGMTQTPLPIILSAFEARRMDRATVALSWTTAMESNNKGFDVEGRTDADTVFGYKAFVPSAATNGNSNAELTYRYTDPNNYGGVSYYRLRQTDLDGRYTYSMIRAVSGDGTMTVTVLLFPNPGNGQFKIRLEGLPQSRMVRIIDQRGALVRVMTVKAGSDLLVGGLRAGAYIVQVVDAFGGGKSFTEKLLILP
jgi:hypothetical protein